MTYRASVAGGNPLSLHAKEARWVPLIERLSKVGLFPADPKAIAEVQAQATKGAPW